MRVEYRAVDGDKVVEMVQEGDYMDFWTEQAEMFTRFLVGQGFIINKNELGEHINKHIVDRIEAECYDLTRLKAGSTD